MTETPPLLAFLHARLDDDEEVASDAAGLGAFRRHWMRDAISCVVDATDNGLIVYGEGKPTSEQADHIARHDPDRVLREVAIKRTLLAGHEQDVHRCAFGDFAVGDECHVQRILATAYVDHPDYDEDWKPVSDPR